MQLTAQEKSTGELTSASLDLAQQTLSQQGFVVLEAVLPAHWVVTMRETFTAELQLNYSPDGVYLDDLCYAIIINDPNYCAMSLTASEPYHQDTQRDLKPPD